VVIPPAVTGCAAKLKTTATIRWSAAARRVSTGTLGSVTVGRALLRLNAALATPVAKVAVTDTVGADTSVPISSTIRVRRAVVYAWTNWSWAVPGTTP
jgi:hypothetical protein